MALSMRLYITCSILPLSAVTIVFFASLTIVNFIFFFELTASRVSIELCISSSISKSSKISSGPLLLQTFKSLRPLVKCSSRFASDKTIPRYLFCISGGMVPSIIASI